MKNLIIAAAIAVLFLLTGCDKPNPVQLEKNSAEGDEQSIIEVLSANPKESNAEYGYDTTAFYKPDEAGLRYGAALFIARNRQQSVDSVNVTNFAEFYLFDKDFPIHDSAGNLITYKTKKIDHLKINNYLAKELAHKFRWRRRGTVTDSILGPKYRLYGRGGVLGTDFELDYSQPIDVKLKFPQRPQVQFEITAPVEIIGIVQKTVYNGAEVLQINWNRSTGNEVEILVGAPLLATGQMIPIYRIRTRDDGQYIIPPVLMRAIPRNQFGPPMVTLLRKKEVLFEGSNGELIVVTYSTCTIKPGN